MGRVEAVQTEDLETGAGQMVSYSAPHGAKSHDNHVKMVLSRHSQELSQRLAKFIVDLQLETEPKCHVETKRFQFNLATRAQANCRNRAEKRACFYQFFKRKNFGKLRPY